MNDLFDCTSLAVCVEIAGLKQRFYSHFPPTGFGGIIHDNVAGTAVPFDEIPGIIDTSDYAWRIDPRECRASYQPFWIDIATDGVDALPGDAADYLDRIAADECGWSANVLHAVGIADGIIRVDAEAPATFSYPMLLDLDGECVEATAFLGTGVPGDEWRFVVGRGKGMTSRRRHVVTPLLGGPTIREHFTVWENRKVSVRVVPLSRRNKAIDDWKELFVGVLTRPPHSDGTAIRLEVAPLSTLMDMEINGEEAVEVGMHEYYHAFTDISANGIDVMVETLDPGAEARYLFRHLWNPPPAASIGYNWPAAIADANASFAAETAAGAPYTVRIVNNGDSWRLAVKTEDAITDFRVWVWSSLDLMARVFVEEPVSLVDGSGPIPDHLKLTFGLDLARDGSGLKFPAREGLQLRENQRVGGQRVSSAVGEWVWNDRVRTGGAPGHEISHVIRGPAAAFYEVGEPWIVVNPTPDGSSPVTVPLMRPATVRVTFHDRATDETREIMVRVTESDPVVTPAGNAFALRLHREDAGQVPAFGNIIGKPPARFKQAATFEGVSPGRMILELLESRTGQLVNGPFDVHPVGVGLQDSFIDEASIGSIPAPDGADERTLDIIGSVKVSDLVGQALLLARHVLVMKTGADGYSRLTAVPIGPAAASEAIDTLIESDFTIDGPGSNDTWTDVVNEVEFKVPLEDGTEREIRVPNPAGVGRKDGETQKIEVDLTNTRPIPAHDDIGEIENRVVPIAAAIFNDIGEARRIWRGDVPLMKLLFVPPGGVMKFTHSRLRGTTRTSSTGGRYGVEEQPARLLSARIPIMSGGAAAISAAHHGYKLAGWNAALKVIAIVDPMTVQADLAYYSDDDLAGFAVGDKARIEPAGNQDAAVGGANITAIDTVTGNVTFDVAHALAAPYFGYVVPEEYTSGSAHQRELAYYSDTDGKITPTVDGVRLG